MDILAIHQGSELYGSDRSFAMSVNSLLGLSNVNVDVFLPNRGEILNLLKPEVRAFIYEDKGFLRKYKLKKNPLSAFFGLISSFFYCLKLFKRYDIVYINTVVCVSAILASCFSKSKVYVHVREIPTGLSGSIFRTLLRLSHAKLIFNSQATKNHFGLEGSVLLNAVVPSESYTALDDSYALPLKLLIIGRINDWKGQDFVLKALSSLEEQVNVEIDIVGDVFEDQHDYLDNLKYLASKLKSKVTFHGFLEDPSSMYKHCHFTIVPSLKPEPFGRVAIESFYYGKPVIASNHGGLLEIINNGINGFLFNAGDEKDFINCLSKALFLSPSQYESMCNKAVNDFHANFSYSTYSKRLLKILELT